MNFSEFFYVNGKTRQNLKVNCLNADAGKDRSKDTNKMPQVRSRAFTKHQKKERRRASYDKIWLIRGARPSQKYAYIILTHLNPSFL